MVKAAGLDEVDNLHDQRHDISKVGRLGAQGLLLDDGVHLLDRLSVSDSLTLTH